MSFIDCCNDNNRPLGPFQEIWDRWTPALKRVKKLPLSHFAATEIIQIGEALEHLKQDNPEGAVNEMVDVISVAFNWMRAMGLDEYGVVEALQRRAVRYSDPNNILDKYQRLFRERGNGI